MVHHVGVRRRVRWATGRVLGVRVPMRMWVPVLHVHTAGVLWRWRSGVRVVHHAVRRHVRPVLRGGRRPRRHVVHALGVVRRAMRRAVHVHRLRRRSRVVVRRRAGTHAMHHLWLRVGAGLGRCRRHGGARLNGVGAAHGHGHGHGHGRRCSCRQLRRHRRWGSHGRRRERGGGGHCRRGGTGAPRTGANASFLAPWGHDAFLLAASLGCGYP